MNLILGAGLSGLSSSYHLGHERCVILEKTNHAFGHIRSTRRQGFVWDEGPHVSFTTSPYVRELFSESVAGEFEEHEVRTSNFFRGTWIDHPAQSNLYQIPEPLRSECLESFLASRPRDSAPLPAPANYQQFLEQSFGKVFADTFPAAYTRKYWTCEPSAMTTDWVGGRVFQPNIEDVTRGAEGPLDRQTHYITRIRYPKSGGFQSFARQLHAGANIQFGKEVTRINLAEKKLWTADGGEYAWTRLINTLPLPTFVAACTGLSDRAYTAARELACSELLLVNVTGDHPTVRSENWMYVYDEGMYSTRINCTEILTSGNAPLNQTGVQVEVYASRFSPFGATHQAIRDSVQGELIEMGLIREGRLIDSHTVSVPWANVIFTHETKSALEDIWSELEAYGLQRERDDVHPLTDWKNAQPPVDSNLLMAGRFGQWKYFWTDDCVLRGRGCRT